MLSERQKSPVFRWKLKITKKDTAYYFVLKVFKNRIVSETLETLMKKTTQLRWIVFALMFFQSYFMVAQNYVPFTKRFDRGLKGDMLIIGNNIVGQHKTRPYNGTSDNNSINMVNIDVDSDNTTVNSSSATLKIPKANCYKIVYAGLYWGALERNASIIEQVKFKLPTGGYVDVVGSIIYDNFAYACYADVTNIVSNQADAQGEYTVANVKANTGYGAAAGWSLFVVYEDPTLPSKFITSFDGFSKISNGNLNIPVSGFTTVPSGPVRAKFAFTALEGDRNIAGDFLSINNSRISVTNGANQPIRPVANFFNSTITHVDPVTGITENFMDRVPPSTNTISYDAGVLNVNNPQNRVIRNNATSANITLGSSGDVYYYYFSALAIDVIEPNIALTKVVKNTAGTDVGGQTVALGDYLTYEIGFQNTGSDDATSFTIRDVLPDNVIFDYPAGLGTLPSGVTVQSYNVATKEITFAIDDALVRKNSLNQTVIKLQIQVDPDCNSYVNACSDSIDNSAYATYRGIVSSSIITDDPSINSNVACVLTPQPTNFVADISNCQFIQNVTLCGTSIDLTAGSGYNSYTWYSDAALTNQIGTGQTLNVTNSGTYYVRNVSATCTSITQSFVVTDPGNVSTNPVSPFEDDHAVCLNDGKELPHIILCGANVSRNININISGTTSIVWERLDTASCTATSNPDCANEDPACTWNSVGSGSSYTANTAGQYRLTLNYTGGCFSRFYFNVYTNLLNPTETHKDIICTTPGNITIGGVSGSYEYSIDGVNYVPSNSFDIATPGLYTAYIRQVNAPANSCIFTISNILISQPIFTATRTIVDPLCYGGTGEIHVGANGIGSQSQYYYRLLDATGTQIDNVGPISQSNYNFTNLPTNANYTIEVTTDDGCFFALYAYIQGYWNQPFIANAALIEPLTSCDYKGKIKVITTGGSAPYFYYINGSTNFQTSDEIDITAPGVYDIEVLDSNNCAIQTSITVTDNPKPVYTLTSTNSNCYNGAAEIRVTVANANGYAMSYSVDNGVTFQNTPLFSNLYPGTYDVVVKYGISYSPVPGQAPVVKYCEDKSQIVITGPTSAISASGGVAGLTGCTLAGQGGKLRINNVQGGTAPYEYSFDDGITWQPTKEKDVLPGQYILKVKDAIGCEYTIPYSVILDPKPSDPIITIDPPVFNCNGTATTVVTVTNNSSANFSYEFYLDGIPNTPITNTVFTNVTSGNHMVTVDYKVTSVSTYSNLLIEDFGRGDDTTTPGIHPAYCWEKQDNVIDCNGSILLNDGEYVVTKALLPDHANNFNWVLPKDNTAVINNTPQIVDGRFLAVNVGGVVPIGGILYKKTIVDVIPNQDIQVSLYMLNLLAPHNNLPSPQLAIELRDANGVTIPGASKTTALIPRDGQWHDSTTLGNGQVLTLNPGNNTTLDFVILSNSQVITGNDLAIDDIWVRQIPESCLSTKDFPFVVPTDKAFKASVTGFKDVSCFGQSNGEVTITAENFKPSYGFDYSLDNGTTWINSMVSPVTITGLSATNYNIQVRYDASASTCVQPIAHTVGSPPLLTISASVTSLATCIQGATITATATGGTTPYEFELRDAAGVAVIAPFQSSGIFTNV
ncbi:SprB repeat-containing protein, partial [Flavobacterium hercynium]